MNEITKYDQLGTDDAMLFAIAKTRTLLRTIGGEAGAGASFGGEDDIPWVQQTCDEIVALLERASQLEPFK